MKWLIVLLLSTTAATAENQLLTCDPDLATQASEYTEEVHYVGDPELAQILGEVTLYMLCLQIGLSSQVEVIGDRYITYVAAPQV